MITLDRTAPRGAQGHVMAERRPERTGSDARLRAAPCVLVLAAFFVGLSAIPASAATCSGDVTMTIDLASGEAVVARAERAPTILAPST